MNLSITALLFHFLITPLAIIRPEPSQAPGGHTQRCYQTIFLILRLSEPRPTLGKQLAQGRPRRPSENRTHCCEFDSH